MLHRAEKLNKIFLHKISEIINREIDFGQETLVTITQVKVAPDLSQAKIFVSVLPFSKSQEVILILNRHRQLLVKFLNQAIKIRKIPRLIFLIDDTEEEASRIEKIINNLEISD